MKRGIHERLWSKVTRRGPDECWPWTAATAGGYGTIYYQGSYHRSHRIVYMLEHPDEDIGALDVCHHCDTKLCCNPGHLFAGTTKDNMQDMLSKGRNRPNKGVLNGRAKLTEDQVRAMRSLREQGWSWKRLGKMFGVSHPMARYVRLRMNWTHI